MINIINWLSDEGVSFDWVNDENVTLDCPWCGKAKGHFRVHRSEGVFRCFRCDEKGKLPKLISKIKGVPIGEARELVYGRVLDRALLQDFVKDYAEKRGYKPDDLKKISLPPAFPITARVREYIKSRGITNDQIMDYDIYYSRAFPVRERIIFPIRMNGKVVSYQARATRGFQSPKYFTCPNTDLGGVLFNYDNITSDRPVIVVEGIIDALRVIKDYDSNVVATFGKEVCNNQAELLVNKGVKDIILVYDSDTLGKINDKMTELNSKFNVKIAPILEGDPADVPDIRRVFDNTFSNFAEVSLFILKTYYRKSS